MKVISGVCLLSMWLVSCSYSSSKEDRLPYYSSASFTPQWLDAGSADTVHRIPDFSFTDQQGRRITQQSIGNKISVVNFFFTSCPGICKRLTGNMSKVQSAFRNDSDVVLLSHSVTPERDSVPVLAMYAAANGVIEDKWHLLTGARTAIYRMARTAYFADEDLGMQQDSTSFLHTENILLIDKKHHIRGVYKGTAPSEIDNLVADIKKLKEE